MRDMTVDTFYSEHGDSTKHGESTKNGDSTIHSLKKNWIKQLKFVLFGQSKRKTTETNARVHKREILT